MNLQPCLRKSTTTPLGMGNCGDLFSRDCYNSEREGNSLMILVKLPWIWGLVFQIRCRIWFNFLRHWRKFKYHYNDLLLLPKGEHFPCRASNTKTHFIIKKIKPTLVQGLTSMRVFFLFFFFFLLFLRIRHSFR